MILFCLNKIKIWNKIGSDPLNTALCLIYLIVFLLFQNILLERSWQQHIQNIFLKVF